MLPGEGRKICGRRAGKDRNEGDRALAGRAGEAEAHLALDPVHQALGADKDDKGSRVAGDRNLDLLLPAAAGFKVVLVEPNPDARFARVG
jgi:hypothetical protein